LTACDLLMPERFRQAVEIYTDSPRMLLPLLNTHFGPPGTIKLFTYMPWRQSAGDFVTAGLRDAILSLLERVGMPDAATRIADTWQRIASESE
jgi:hypothetical protein